MAYPYLSETQRKYPIVGSLADLLTASTSPERTQQARMLAEFFGLPSMATTLDRISYGEPLTTGTNQTLQMKPETAESLLGLVGMVAPTGKPAAALTKETGAALKPMVGDALESAADMTRMYAAPKQTGSVAPNLVPLKSIQDLYPNIEPDVLRSIKANKQYKSGVPVEELEKALAVRSGIRSQPSTLPKPVTEMTDAELADFGRQYGVDFSQSPMQKVQDPVTGQTWEIPGGLEGKFSYPDMHRLKAMAYNPNSMSDAFHAELQKKLLRSQTPEVLDDVEVFNRTMFGMMSPNTPLLPNQFGLAAMRARTPEDIQGLANYITKNPDDLTKGERSAIDKLIGIDKNMQASGAGGMGMRSSVDMSNIAQFAQQMMDNPEFYRKMPDETWQQAAERVGNTTRGLSAKTGSFGVVWQDPAKAATSAMDRHMARNYFDQAMQNPEIKTTWEAEMPKLWNSQLERHRDLSKQLKSKQISKDEYVEKSYGLPPLEAKKIRNFAQLESQPNSYDWQLGRIEERVAQHEGGKYRLKSGEINPRVPEHLRNMPIEPKDFFTFGPLYRNMLETNAQNAEKYGLGVFGEQWRHWDRIRGQVEPHESMYPGLHKLPRLSDNELLNAYQAQKEAGFASTGKATPYDWKKGFYYGLTPIGVTGAGLTSLLGEDPERLY